MTQDDVRAAAEQLVQFHDRFAPLFGKQQAQDHAYAYTYLPGLMARPERKSIEPIALSVGTGQVFGLQKFIGVAPWAYFYSRRNLTFLCFAFQVLSCDAFATLLRRT